MTRPTDCDALRELLDERLDGGLDAERSARLESHLGVCADCRTAAAQLETLRTATDRLPRELEPARDLWPGVERRLEPRRGWLHSVAALMDSALRRPAPFFAAAAAGLALTVAVWIWRTEPAPTGSPTATPASLAVDAESIASRNRARAELARFEDGVLLAHQDLLEAVQSQPDRFSPETLEALEENMRIIDQAIGQIRTALDDDPFNHRLNLLLAAQYQHEVQLLKRLSGV